MLRTAEVDWKLRVAAAELCPRQSPGFGLWLDQSASHPASEASALLRTLRLGRSLQVAAVAESSPGALAGIRTGDEVEEVGETNIAHAFAISPDQSLFPDEIMDFLSSTSSGRPLTLILRRGKMTLRKSMSPIQICSGRTILETNPALDAHTDDRDISISTALVNFTANDDELALFLGHELAHAILADQATQAANDSQAVELAADILGASIARCAGYDMKLGNAVWRRFDAQDPFRLSRLSTHPVPREREQRLEAALVGSTCPPNLPSIVAD